MTLIALLLAFTIACAGARLVLYLRDREARERFDRECPGLREEQEATIPELPTGPSMPRRQRLEHRGRCCGYWNTLLRGATPDSIWCPRCDRHYPGTKENHDLADAENLAGFYGLLAACEGAELLKADKHERA